MAGEVEPAKKILLPYLQRADELQKHEPLVAYYCRLYAMERGLKIPVKERTKTTNAILVSLMNQLEKDKKSVPLSPEDNLHVEGFALNVFTKADKQDRAGRADLNTAKTFYAASIFVEILHQFGPLQPDMEQKQKYAVWKAADIRKALSEGRKPIPGPPGGDEQLPFSGGGASDFEVSPEKETVISAERRPPVEQSSNAGVEMPSSSIDGAENFTQFTPQVSQPDYNHHHSSSMEFPTPKQPPDSSVSSYTSPYAGSYYPSSSSPDTSVSPLMTAHQYGLTSTLDGANGQSYQGNYHQYTPTLPDGPGTSGMPATYFTHPGGSEGVFYQSPGGHAPSAAVYSASTFSSSDYGSFASGDTGGVRTKDSSGLERRTSAPVAVKGQIYQPPPEKIVEVQKVARFAVSALAFDDVPTAISYLKQSLELLTNPSASS